MFAELFSIVAPVYLTAALGFLWVRFGRSFDTRMITELVMLVGAPCLVFSALVQLEVERASLLRMAIATTIVTAAFGLVGWLVLRSLKLPRTTYLAPIMFGNTGNLGLPICLFAFGEAGLALGVCFFATTTLLNFTVGLWAWSGRLSVRELLETPLFHATVLAALAVAFEIRVPRWIQNTTSIIGQMTIPLMAFTLGVTLARLRLAHVWRSTWLSIVRFVLVMGTAFVVADLLGLTGLERSVFLVDCAMPPAVINYLLAQKYERNPLEVAGLVVVSTLLAFLVLPAILAWVL